MAFRKLWTALCGASNEAAEAVVDTQAIRILDQEIREAKTAITESGHGLTKIAAKRKLSENKVTSLDTEIAKYTNAARQHAETDRELALECAQKVADLNSEKSSESSILASFTKSEETLKRNIKSAKSNLRRLEQQVDQVKATESVQKAQVAASTTYTGGNAKMKTAMDSLDRIQAKQLERSAELEAAEEIANDESGASLESRLANAGSPSSSEDALTAILAKS
jgi:phage shock protein A